MLRYSFLFKKQSKADKKLQQTCFGPKIDEIFSLRDEFASVQTTMFLPFFPLWFVHIILQEKRYLGILSYKRLNFYN